jgi:integrase
MRSIFSEPAIYPFSPEPADMDKTWRVRFRYFHSGKWHQISRKGILNSISSYSERKQEAGRIIHILKTRLGFRLEPSHEHLPRKDLQRNGTGTSEILHLRGSPGLCASEEKKRPFPKSYQDYRSCIKFLKSAAEDLQYTKQIKDFRRADFKIILEEVTDQRKLGPTGYNKYRTFLSSLVGELVEWDIMEVNPVRDIKTKDTPRHFAHRPPTKDQRIAIISRIKEVNRPYYRFLSVLYGCAIRPIEITRLQVKHLNKMEGVFRLPANLTKNRQEAEVAVPHWLMDLLSEMNLHSYPGDYYIFSGRGSMFLPGKNKMHANSTHTLWKKIVKAPVKEGGLGMDVDLYSFKKMSADDLVLLQRREGADNLLSGVREHFRHSDEKQTEVYTQEHKRVVKDLIREKMPVL